MFKSGFIRLRNIYNSISKLYTLIILHHPYVTIICYLLLITSFSLGLFQIRFDRDSERLTELRNSRFRRDKSLLDETFVIDHRERFLQYKITDIGYYIEIIVKSKNDSIRFGKEHPHLFEEYNTFFDHLLELTIEDHVESGGDSADDIKVYKYEHLCARRLDRCAIEGGLARKETFQKAFLTNQISYKKSDTKKLYLDTTESDGLSMDFTFGWKRKEKCKNETVNDEGRDRKSVV